MEIILKIFAISLLVIYTIATIAFLVWLSISIIKDVLDRLEILKEIHENKFKLCE